MERGCELCEGVAALYCGADEAYVCWTCDAKVHSANFLVARHTRSVLCKMCSRPTLWRASGADPTPLTCLCSNCTDGECYSHADVGAPDNQGVSRSSTMAGGSGSGYESGCSSCNSEILNGTVSKRGSKRASSFENGSRFTKEDLEGLSANVNVAASVPSDTSQVIKKRTVGLCSPMTALESCLTVTRNLEDDGASVTNRQCESDASTSSSHRDNHANQGQTPDTRSWHHSSMPASRLTSGAVNTLALPSSKQRRTFNSRQLRPSLLSRNQQASLQSNARLMRIFAKWHWDLRLSSPGTVPLAVRLFRKVSRVLPRAILSSSGTCVTLAACLRLAAELDDAQLSVPKVHEVALCAGISARSLAMIEIQLRALLEWGRVPVWAGPSA